MGADYRWIMCGLETKIFEDVSITYKEIVVPPVLSDRQKSMLDLCESNSNELLQKYVPPESLPSGMDRNKYANGFIDNEETVQNSVSPKYALDI